MFKRKLVRQIAGVLALFTLVSFSHALTNEEYDLWLKESELGPYQPQEENWDAIMERAQKEPPLLIYVDTSRLLPVVDAFNAEHGLNIEAINLSTNDVIERSRREWDAGLRNPGIIMTGNPALIESRLISRRAITNYVPRELQKVIPPHEWEPVLRHRYSVGTWYYKNDEGKTGVPYDSIWALTSEEWRNRVVMRDPLASGTLIAVFAALISNADELAVMYEDYFGRPIELTTPNAGYELVKRMLDNDLRIVPNARDVAETVSQATGRMVGLSTQSLYRDVIAGRYDFELDTQVAPTVLTLRNVGIGSMTESPNQAKLMVRHVMSQEGGKPWWGADFPVNPLIEPTGPMADLRLSSFATLWEPSVQEMIEIEDDFVDFFIQYR